MRERIKDMTSVAIAAALYVVLNIVLSGISFGAIQLRLACMLYLLCRHKSKYIYACILGTAIANLYSPFGIIDIAFGVVATALACTSFYFCRKLNIFISSSINAIIVGIVIGIELYLIYGGSLLLLVLSVSAGQLIVYFLGCLIMPRIYKILR